MKKLKEQLIKVLLNLFVTILKLIYLIFKILPTTNKVVLISRQSNSCTKDFELLKEQFKYELPNYKIEVLTKRIGNKFAYMLHIIKQMYNIATAKVCIIDSYSIPISVLKHKKTLNVVQIWHAMGAIKQFGHQCIGKNSGRNEIVSKALKMHDNYDLILSGSEAMTCFYSEAFKYDRNYFFVNNLPRMDYIAKNKENLKLKLQISDAYKGIFNKKTILYAPTFRKNNQYFINDLIDKVNFDKYNLIIKMHPNKGQEIPDNRVYKCENHETIDLMLFTDVLITDYSAISIEASALGKPVYFYLYDYEDYKENTGLNVDLMNEYPGMVYEKAEDIFENIDNGAYEYSQLKKFENKFVSENGNNATELIVKKIIETFELK